MRAWPDKRSAEDVDEREREALGIHTFENFVRSDSCSDQHIITYQHRYTQVLEPNRSYAGL